MGKKSALNDKQKRFVQEYLVDLNATQAAERAGYSKQTAYQIGFALLKKLEVQAAISAAMQKRAERTEITQDMVLQRWWQLANANANDLVQYRRVCCRFCHGAGHQYQWTESEFLSAQTAYAKLPEEEKAKVSEPDIGGGFGFDPIKDPHAECPRCRGEGVGEPHVLDTRKLTGAASLLYAGVKVTREGIEVKMRDQDKALENVARHLGMFKDKVELSGEDGAPLSMAVRFVNSSERREKS